MGETITVNLSGKRAAKPSRRSLAMRKLGIEGNRYGPGRRPVPGGDTANFR